ncbi:MAG: bifunctional acetate--CoA ligase family protein/GNAT family N-acetyltransferase [Candidatus Bathyarchaeota archaeon]|nr:bifunctional acetate--CoA ligase family protein/GNAT family N-acetyltransferase [Candidatus Bathyarchaeota archaeon]
MERLSLRTLDKIFNPTSIAVIGASDREGSVGYRLFRNLIGVGYRGVVYPVNHKRASIQGVEAYPSVDKLPRQVDLAMIATPAETVPGIVEQCGKAGIQGIIIVSAGFKEIGSEGKALEQRILETRKKYNMRIIGPNCLGVIHPHRRLNASFAAKMALPGNIAFISQSGALCTAILDWANSENIGFSNFVSIGSMIDVDYGDLIDYFGSDPQTRSIIMYIEGLTNARKFMSAARHFARTKTILVVKAGKYSESAKAATSHTGSLTGEDAVYDAAFRRAGVIRVEEIEDLFNCSEVLQMQPNPKGPNIAIITNAGGPGVMATDALIARGGKLAELSPKAKQALDQILPNYWSRGNPIDILGDATPERYAEVVKVCRQDENINGILIIFTPQGITNPAEAATAVVEACKGASRTILTSWMGEQDVEEANEILNRNGLPTYSTPERAIKTYTYMYQYTRNLAQLYETPEELPIELHTPAKPLLNIMRKASKEEREILTEIEAKAFLEAYGIKTVKTKLVETEDEAVSTAKQLGYPAVLKVYSPQITHKTDVGGVMLNLQNDLELREAYRKIFENVKKNAPSAGIQGVTVQNMIANKEGYEVIIGSKKDPIFGPIILFGMGGIMVELFQDRAIGFPPLNQTLARLIMERTRVYELLKGFRGLPPANIKRLEEVMVKFSEMLVDLPQIKEIDINPLVVDSKDAVALDARIFIDRSLVYRDLPPHEHLVISPYPKKYEREWKLKDGRPVFLRPIKPEDEPLESELWKTFSEETQRFRFFSPMRTWSHATLVKYTNIDYDREIAIIAELTEHGEKKMIGVVRMIMEPPDFKTAEVAIVVGDPWQGLGLGSRMMDYIIEIAKDRKLETVYGLVLRDNNRAIELFKEKGFAVDYYSIKKIVKTTLEL